MAKMKRFLVEVEVPVKLQLFVEARRPGGAEARIRTEEGWRDAMMYEEPHDLRFSVNPATMNITKIREM